MMSGINIKTSILVLLLAPFAAFWYSRYQVLSLAYFNAQSRMPRHANFTSYEIKFADQIRSCEDALLVESRGLAIVPCDPGRETWNTVMGNFVDNAPPDPNAELYAYNYSSSSPSASSLTRIRILNFPSSTELRTLGLEYHEPSSTLLVTNHRRAGARIEQFQLDLDTLTATHVRSLPHPLIYAPNSIAALSESEFFVTNQHYFPARSHRLLWALETYLAPPIASVAHVRILPNGTVDAAVVARLAYANGLALLRHDTTLAVASTNTRLVKLFSISSSSSTTSNHPTLTQSTSFPVPFLPDNLSVSKGQHGDEALLIAGHPHLPSLGAFARSRRTCNRPELLSDKPPEQREEAEERCKTLSAASWASEWTPEGGVQHIYSGWEYPTSASVVRDKGRGVGIVAGLYAKGLLVWRD